MISVGAEIKCDGSRIVLGVRDGGCRANVKEDTEAEAFETAKRLEWSVEDDYQYCRDCTKKRASRKPLSELVPDGVTLYTAHDAAIAEGFKPLSEDADGNLKYLCCGKEVSYVSGLFSASGAFCTVCNRAIRDITLSAGNSSIAFVDSDKYVIEVDEYWVAMSEFPIEAEAQA